MKISNFFVIGILLMSKTIQEILCSRDAGPQQKIYLKRKLLTGESNSRNFLGLIVDWLSPLNINHVKNKNDIYVNDVVDINEEEAEIIAVAKHQHHKKHCNCPTHAPTCQPLQVRSRKPIPIFSNR